MNAAHLVEQILCGSVAAVGFGILFNVSGRLLPWCAGAGGSALAVRTCCLELGWNLEGASFAAALVVAVLLHLLQTRTNLSVNLLDVVGCIPMVPGSFAAKAIVGMFALTTSSVGNNSEALITATQYSLRVMFTIGAIGTGLAIPTLLWRSRQSV
jgi:uncharacterized membrane protein YjjB (DUF3815 family)